MHNENCKGFKMNHGAVHLNLLAMTLLLIPYYKPGSLEYIAPAVDVFFDNWLVIASMVIITLYLFNRKLSKIILVIISYTIALTISTVINSGDYFSLLKNTIRIISHCMLFELGTKYSIKDLLKSLVFVLGIECAINSITILKFPNGLYDPLGNATWAESHCFFLGYDNANVMYLLPFLCAFLIYATYKKYNRIAKIAVVLLFSATVYITWAAATVVSITIFILLVVMSEYRMQFKVLKYKYFIAAILIVFFALVVFRLQNLLKPIIVDLLGKDLTLSGRTRVWDRAIGYIAHHPIFGMGEMSSEENYLLLGVPHAHSFFLRVQFEAGIIGSACILAILILVGKAQKGLSKNKYCFFMSATVFCLFIIMLTESFFVSSVVFSTLTMAYHIKSLIAGLDRPKENGNRLGENKNESSCCDADQAE